VITLSNLYLLIITFYFFSFLFLFRVGFLLDHAILGKKARMIGGAYLD
jgi:hypothetical protein